MMNAAVSAGSRRGTRSKLVRQAEHMFPKIALSARANLDRSRREPEIRVLMDMVDPNRACVDIGANRGVYAYWFRRLGAPVWAIEPNPVCARLLRRSLPAGVTLIEAACSDHAGVAVLRTPEQAGEQNTYRSTIEQDVVRGPSAQVTVDTVTLDSLEIPDVGAMKIDVEGHELAALKGAACVLRTSRPIVQVEAEERHREGAVESVVELMSGLEYRTYFVWENTLRPFEEFSLRRHQDAARACQPRAYANNFLFVPEEDAARRHQN